MAAPRGQFTEIRRKRMQFKNTDRTTKMNPAGANIGTFWKEKNNKNLKIDRTTEPCRWNYWHIFEAKECNLTEY